MFSIETERLFIRSWRIGALEDFYEHASSVNVAKFAGWKPIMDKEVAEKSLKKIIEKNEAWAIEDKESGKVLGKRIYDGSRVLLD